METIAKNIVNAILDDISDRRGIGDEWDGIDEDIQDKIKEKWEEIINVILKEEVAE